MLMRTDVRRQLVDLLPRLRRQALVLTRSTDASDDLVQSTMERALARIEQWELGTQLDLWMFQIMRTVWLNDRRQAAIRHHENIDDHRDYHSVDGVRDIEAKLILAQVRPAFNRLPAAQRQAYFLVILKGHTYAEAAELLGVPVGTVISRVARGRSVLLAEISQLRKVSRSRDRKNPTSRSIPFFRRASG